jgi:transcriptional regulator with AAA-type ATPase domain
VVRHVHTDASGYARLLEISIRDTLGLRHEAPITAASERPLGNAKRPDMNLTFDEHRPELWPATIILEKTRKQATFHSLLKLVTEVLRPHRFRSDREVDPVELKSPATAEQVLRWIEAIWRRMQSADNAELIATRRAIFEEIVNAPLIQDEQSRLLSALDYLFRLCTARNVARSSGTGDLALIPHTGNHSMQAAYQKLAGLAATDLPVWIAGEAGTELESFARLVHTLRGLPPNAFHVWDSGRSWSAALSELRDELGPDATIFVHGISSFSETFQKMLYQHLMAELSSAAGFRIVVSSAPLEPSNLAVPGMIPELFAFLNPMRLEIPPLRNRTGDIPALIRFFCVSRGEEDPIDRFDRQALHALAGYHWPGNVAELEVTVAFALKKRPSGPIRLEDLPDTVNPRQQTPAALLDAFEEMVKEQGFRVLRSDEGRRSMALFLSDHEDRTFGAGDVQRFFRMGRETARRLLHSLVERGLVEGITGAEGKRVTRYRVRRPE